MNVKKTTINRSAVTGRLVSAAEAAASPDTHTSETVLPRYICKVVAVAGRGGDQGARLTIEANVPESVLDILHEGGVGTYFVIDPGV